jgi:hypothetical protein
MSQAESAYIYYLAAEQGRLVYFALRQFIIAHIYDYLWVCETLYR